MMTPSLLSTNIDLLFIILSFLPAETLLLAKSVCRAWAQVISDPAFLRAHYSRPTPITAFFTLKLGLPEEQTQRLKPLQKGAKFPSSIFGILSNGFKAVCSSNGLLCFRRGEIFLVGNPAISHWTIVDVPLSFQDFDYHGAVLLYDPAVSYHFKLVVAMLRLHRFRSGPQSLCMRIYSSKDSSWSMSSSITQYSDRDIIHFGKGISGGLYMPSKVAGGSISWADDYGFLTGYDVAGSRSWKIERPQELIAPQSYHWAECDSIMHYISLSDGNVKVWRLEEDEGWVLEGEGSSEVLAQFVPQSFGYDRARGALLVGGRSYNEVFAFHLSSSRLEVISEADGEEFPQDGFDIPGVAHANTLAPLDATLRDADVFHRLFPGLHLS